MCVPGLLGGGSGPVEVQVLLSVGILQEMQGRAARSVDLPGGNVIFNSNTFYIV